MVNFYVRKRKRVLKYNYTILSISYTKIQCTACPSEQHLKDNAPSTSIKCYRINCQERIAKGLEESGKITTNFLKILKQNEVFVFSLDKENGFLDKRKIYN